MPVQAIDSDFIRLVLNFDVFCFHYCNVAKLGKYQDFSEIFHSFFILPRPESLVNSIIDFLTQSCCPFIDQPGLTNSNLLAAFTPSCCCFYTTMRIIIFFNLVYNTTR